MTPGGAGSARRALSSLVIVGTQGERAWRMTVDTLDGQDPLVAPVLTNIPARDPGRAAPEVGNIWFPNSLLAQEV